MHHSADEVNNVGRKLRSEVVAGDHLQPGKSPGQRAEDTATTIAKAAAAASRTIFSLIIGR
jgi:hypothetical protein